MDGCSIMDQVQGVDPRIQGTASTAAHPATDADAHMAIPQGII